MLKKYSFIHGRLIIEKKMLACQTLVESYPALKYENLKRLSSQTCIKVALKVIINVPEQENTLCQLVWETIKLIGQNEIFAYHDTCSKLGYCAGFFHKQTWYERSQAQGGSGR